MYTEGRERRRAHRIRVPGGRAVCRSKERELSCVVRDASPQGIALEGALDLCAGADVSLDIEWPGIGHAHCEGRVVRGGRCAGIAVSFSPRDSDFELLIAELSRVQEALSQKLAPVLYAPVPWDVAAVQGAFDELGVPAESACTRLEVLWRFQDESCRGGVLFFDASAAALEMARFIGEEFPAVRRVMVVERDQLEQACGACELGFCDAVVPIDACAAELGRALGVGARACLSCGAAALGELLFCSTCRERSRQASLTELDDLGVGD